MTCKALYLAIGDIDDDLIQEASEAHGRKPHRVNFIRLAALAACLCLAFVAAFFGLHKDVVYYNEARAPFAAKGFVPSDESTTTLTLSYEELFDYYHLKVFPDNLSGLQRLERSCYFVYQLGEGAVSDANTIHYYSSDKTQSLSVFISTTVPHNALSGEDVKGSSIAGVPLTLAVDNAENATTPIYWAEMERGGVFVRVVSSGIDEGSFTALLGDLIQSQK